MTRTQVNINVLVLLLLALVIAPSGGVIGGRATAATYVYEKDTTAIPAGILTAFDKLNRKGIVATPFEQDTVDGNGKTPEQYTVPLAAAKETGLPSLVVTAQKRVLKVVKDPKTEEEVLKVAN